MQTKVGTNVGQNSGVRWSALTSPGSTHSKRYYGFVNGVLLFVVRLPTQQPQGKTPAQGINAVCHDLHSHYESDHPTMERAMDEAVARLDTYRGKVVSNNKCLFPLPPHRAVRATW